MRMFILAAGVAELIVRIHNQEGHVEWTIPASIRRLTDRPNQERP
jgi:hypothetical protein